MNHAMMTHATMTRAMMYASIAALVGLLALCAFATSPAAADPYRWCAVYGNSDDSGTNCYFVTIEQCRAAVSGNGGFCAPNTFYDGRPVTVPGEARPSRNRATR